VLHAWEFLKCNAFGQEKQSRKKIEIIRTLNTRQGVTMRKVAFIYHQDYLKHDTGAGHVEQPDRLRAIVNRLIATPLWKALLHLQPQPAPREWMSTVHTERHIATVEERCKKGEVILDEGDTHVCPVSFDVALLAAGGVLRGVDELMSGRAEAVFCAIRPPGHHAETARAMGFCLFNNVACAARYAQKRYGVERIAILDWDVHHGNGTQEIFYEDNSVFYISLHQYPFYPGTGSAEETGEGKGEGFTLNCPMKAGSGDREYREAFMRKILPSLHAFKPDLIMISAGFDAHRDDPLANINLTDESFAWMTEALKEVAQKYGSGRIVSVLEGGYNLQALAVSVERHLAKLLE
jgi:acetoin utilization deacetylase AcuC-like enzyme